MMNNSINDIQNNNIQNKRNITHSTHNFSQKIDDSETYDVPEQCLSWSDIVERELQCENKLLLSKSDLSVSDTKKDIVTYQYSLSDIVTKNPTEINDLTLMEYETYLSSNLNKYIKQHEIDKDQIDLKVHLPKFEWLMSASQHLCKKLGLLIELHNDPISSIKNGYFPRSSYKFCEFGYECEFNYKHKLKGCYAQHYVHNLVCSDLDVVIKYIRELYEPINTNNNNYIELCKSMKTITYVVKHMFEELVNVKYRYCSNNEINISKYHIEKSNKNKYSEFSKKDFHTKDFHTKHSHKNLQKNKNTRLVNSHETTKAKTQQKITLSI